MISKQLVVHLKGLTAKEMEALGEEPVEALDEEWFEVVAEEGIICMDETTLAKLVEMIPFAIDYTIIER